VLLARDVALFKWDSGTPVEDITREQQVIETASRLATARGLDATFVANFFRAQIEANKTVQYSLLADWHRAGTAPTHSAINLAGVIRPQLDGLADTLLGDLKEAAPLRNSKNCETAVAVTVEQYLKDEGRGFTAVESIALDRSMASFCAH
jgi:chorismate mutase